MRKFEVTVSDEVTYNIEARGEDEAMDLALEYFDQRIHHCSVKEISLIAVSEAPLQEVIESWVETFNDCACCPCRDCPLAFGVDPSECADRIINTILKKGEFK